MINQNRIVPITAVDLITMYGLILKVGSISVTALDAVDTAGDFSQTTNSATVLCSEPVKEFTFGADVSAGTVYFVSAYDCVGFKKTGATLTEAGATVDADGRTLYSATLSSGTLTFAKVGF